MDTVEVIRQEDMFAIIVPKDVARFLTIIMRNSIGYRSSEAIGRLSDELDRHFKGMERAESGIVFAKRDGKDVAKFFMDSYAGASLEWRINDD